MIDPYAAVVSALNAHSPVAFGGVFAAGALTSIGPCVAPRYLAIAAFAHGRRNAAVSIAAYIAGLIGAFAALGFVAGSLGTLWALSSAVYAGLALAMIAAGAVTLVRAEPHAGCERRRGATPLRPASTGGVFLLGAAGTLVISPCCTPVVAAVVSASTAIGQPLTGALLLAVFAAGHALPLACAGSAGARVARRLPHGAPAQAASIVGGALLIALGAFYGALA